MTGTYDEVYERARLLLEERLDGRRLAHSLAVAESAALLAECYGVDVGKARLAGLLHDWDKGLSDEQLLERAECFGVEPWSQGGLVALLHARTGAAALKREFPELGDEVLQAISRHTAAAPDMTALDMVIYVADLIEPLRSHDGLEQLRTLVGTVSLEELFLKSLEMTMLHLISTHRPLHPASLEVWNAYVGKDATEHTTGHATGIGQESM